MTFHPRYFLVWVQPVLESFKDFDPKSFKIIQIWGSLHPISSNRPISSVNRPKFIILTVHSLYTLRSVTSSSKTFSPTCLSSFKRFLACFAWPPLVHNQLLGSQPLAAVSRESICQRRRSVSANSTTIEMPQDMGP
jgi:hypothetical protein